MSDVDTLRKLPVALIGFRSRCQRVYELKVQEHKLSPQSLSDSLKLLNLERHLRDF